MDNDTESVHEQPAYYVAGQRVKVRGCEFQPEEARNGGEYMQWYALVQFAESTATAKVHPSQLKVDSDSDPEADSATDALYRDLRIRGLLPDWAIKNENPPWERDDAEGDF